MTNLAMSQCNRYAYTHTVDPGCCGISVNHTVLSNLFVYLRVVPPHTHFQIHIWVKNQAGDSTRLYVKKNGLPSASDFDITSARTTPPHRLTINSDQITCGQRQAPYCDPWFIGIGGSPVDVRRDNRFDIELTAGDHNNPIVFDVHVSMEFNYTHFGFHECDRSRLPSCGLSLNGQSELVKTQRGSRVLRLTPNIPHVASSAWYETALYLAEGFDSSFQFQISSPTLCVAPFEFFLSARTNDIRKTNYNVDAYTRLSSFDTSDAQYTNGGFVNMTSDMFTSTPVRHTNVPYMSSDVGARVCESGDERWGGEGFAFVIQSSVNGTAAIGCPDTGVGFATDTYRNCNNHIGNSLAIEFDSYFNVTKFELRSRHDHVNTSFSYTYTLFNTISLFTNGTNNHNVPLISRQVHPLRETTLFDGTIHDVLVRYLPPSSTSSGYLFVYLDGVFSKQPVVSIGNIDLQEMGVLDANGKAYIGFTGSTGLAAQNQDILSWSFCQLPGCATY
eukprot:c5573_g1_i2.p1 GENE.c5573_g1_i2~~c5573_g1_i2.p1  ORF type:complete len:516 (-),score=120.30 c5573_g1_i2:19-1524(-)